MKEYLPFGKITFFCYLTFNLFVCNIRAESLSLISTPYAKTDKSKIKSLLSNQPVEFLENKGQIRDMVNNPAPYVLFKAEAPGVHLYITDKGLSYVFLQSEEEENEGLTDFLSGGNKEEEKVKISYERMDMELLGAVIKKENIVKEDTSMAYFNYICGSGPQSIEHVKKYGKITIKNIYPGIDWVLYNSSKSGFKYDFIIHPGADPNQIELVYKTKKELSINKNGDLIINSSSSSLKENAPYSYLVNEQKKVDSKFKLMSSVKKNGRFESHVGFVIAPGTNSIGDLVIDPQLVWCTFYGGVNADGVYCADTDPAGNLFVCGYGSSPNFPLLNAGTYYQTTAAGGYILKFSNTGTLLWATFFGSPGMASGPFVAPSTTSYMAADIYGNVFLCGVIASGVLPTVNASTYFQGSNAGNLDVYIAKFSNTGICLWSTYYGGSLYDESTGLATDQNGNVFLTGTTQSSNFPLQNNSTYFEPTITGSNSGFIVKFDNLGNRLWATYLKGSGAPRVATDGNGRVYVAGSTNSVIPLLNPGGTSYYQGSMAGTVDSYILKFTNNGTHLWGTYYGGNTNSSTSTDMATSLVTDKSGNLFVTGATTATNFPVLNPGNGAYFQTVYNGTGNDMFILKFDSTSTRVWATLLGGSRNDSPSEYDNLTIDTCGTIWMGFNTISRNLPFQQQACSVGFFDNTRDTSVSNAQSNVFIARFSNNGNLVWSSYFAGDGDSHRCTLAADKLGSVFVCGEFSQVTNALTYPTLNPGGTAYFSGWSGDHDLFVSKFSNGQAAAQSFSYTNVCSGDTASQLPITQAGFGTGTFSASPGITVNSLNGRVFPSSAAPGSYTITHLTTGCGACPGSTGAILITATISILTPPTVSITASKPILCVNEQATLTASGANSYSWNSNSTASTLTIAPNVAGIQNYTVTGANINGCTASATIAVSILPSPTLIISASKTVVCVNEQATLTASGANSYTWNIGPTTAAITIIPSTTNALNYTVTGVSANGCGAFGIITVSVLPSPTLNVVATKTVLCVNQQATLTANGASSYTWNTGAIASTISINPVSTAALNYTVTGTATNGCQSQKTYSIGVNKCTGVDELLLGDSKLRIFPNPNTGVFTITSDVDISLSLVNELGQLITQIELCGKNERKITIEGLSNGTYFLRDKNSVVSWKNRIVVLR